VLPHRGALDAVQPEVIVIDSVQTVVDPDLARRPGRRAGAECAHRIVQEARARGTAVVLVGHVTKDGTLAGPLVLEHVVDTVLAFEGDRHHACGSSGR
jgi:DNA repair protein RadA/Sms